MQKIYLLTNHRGAFGNKYRARPYHSGMDKELLSRVFTDNGYNVVYLSPAEIDFRDKKYIGSLILYTTTEDFKEYYKQYVEDIVFGLVNVGAQVIPNYIYLRAHHNKVFMEIIRDIQNFEPLNNIETQKFGTLEEFQKHFNITQAPIVVKTSSGASSVGVYLGKGYKDLLAKVRTASKTKHIREDIKELVRKYKHKGYKSVSRYRQKFITQNYIPNLSKDWKVLVYGDKYYILERPVRKNDFRASGSGKENYLFGAKATIPNGIFDYTKSVYDQLNVPMLSIDIAYANDQFYTLEFQFVGFGTSGQQLSENYFILKDGEWIPIYEELELEEVYASSVVKYLSRQRV